MTCLHESVDVVNELCLSKVDANVFSWLFEADRGIQLPFDFKESLA